MVNRASRMARWLFARAFGIGTTVLVIALAWFVTEGDAIAVALVSFGLGLRLSGAFADSPSDSPKWSAAPFEGRGARARRRHAREEVLLAKERQARREMLEQERLARAPRQARIEQLKEEMKARAAARRPGETRTP